MGILRMTWAGLIVVLATGMLTAEEPGPQSSSASSINAFAFDLYPKIAANGGQNVFCSPYSVYTALTMVAEGAVGQTADEMSSVLKFPPGVRGSAPGIPQVHQSLAGLTRSMQATDSDVVADAQKKTRELQLRFKAVQEELNSLRRTRQYSTAQQLAKTEHSLIKQLDDQHKRVKHYELLVANALWSEQTFPISQKFMEVIDRHYGTGNVFAVDFRQHHEAARDRINGWVAKQTKGRVNDLLPAGSVTPMTRLVLANAIFFRGDWAEPFQAKRTTEEKFHVSANVSQTVPMMANRGHKACSYAAFNSDGSPFATPRKISPDQTEGLYPDPDGFCLIELPYDGDTLSMVLVAPRRIDGLSKLEAMLTAERWEQWMSALGQRKTDVHVPKFRMEAEYQLGTGGAEPSGVLPAMGMGRAFTDPVTGRGAQFDRISASRELDNQLYVGIVRHKAFLEISEQGTEAAAATAVVMMAPTSAAPPVDLIDFVPTFRADRPFVCAIRHRDSGAILFLGRVTDPAP